jgi:hypothetical protein
MEEDNMDDADKTEEEARELDNGVEVITEAREGSGESSEIILKPLLPINKLLVLL